jgi:hypothetical protein
VVDAKDAAIAIRETFMDRPVKRKTAVNFTWPREMQHVGQCLSVAYASDKWKEPGDYELYKHLHDGSTPNQCLCAPRFLHLYESQGDAAETIGPVVSFAGMPMPREFAVLGLFEEANLKLHVAGDDDRPRFGRGDAGIVKVMIKHAKLGGAVIRWSVDGADADQPFIFVYGDDGVYMIVVGDELDIEKDGIVG